MKTFAMVSRFCVIMMCASIIGANDYDYESMLRTKEKDYQEIECTIVSVVHSATEKETDNNVINTSHPHIPGPRSARVPSHMATSTNWSGYVAANKLSSPKKGSVSAVYGTWIVPTLAATPDNSYCSLWVGIDGYSSPTVEQIGTEHDWSNGQQNNYAWFEMYPGGSYLINGFPLNPGDVISASVVFSGGNLFTLKLYNDTEQVFATIPTQYTRSSVAQRTSAEWIMEAPWLNAVLPLSDFGTAYLWGCMATINGVTGPIQNSKWQDVGIQMVTGNGTPKATPSALLPDKGSFFVTWNHE